MTRSAALLLVIMTMASCADPPGAPGAEPPEPQPASVTVTATYDESTCCYIEGFIPSVRIAGPGVAVEKRFKIASGAVTVVLVVPRGDRYTFESWVEPCSGNCGYTDPPTDHCSSMITVPDGGDVAVALTIRTGHPCQITIEGQ